MANLKLTLERAWNRIYVSRIAPLLEKTWTASDGEAIHYLFYPKRRSKKLVVVLQAYHPAGNRYNYISTLQGIKASRLYIKDDFIPRTGDFYLGRSGSFSIEADVHALIRQIMRQCGADQLIFVGSSKGGFAAVNFGIEYPGAAIITAAPMYYLGKYTFETKKFNPALEDIMGAPITEEKIARLNERLPAKVRADSFGNTQRLYIHCSVNEQMYPDHVKDMIEDMRKAGLSVTFDQGSYQEHEDLKYYFPDFLKRSIAKELSR